MSVKALYHRTVPERLRNPLGLARRAISDRLLRILTPAPIPPRELLANIQLTPYANEYLEIGRRSAHSIMAAAATAGLAVGSAAPVLDFGCGSGRTLRHLGETAWQLAGCDIDADAIAWSKKALPSLDLRSTAPAPPLPYRDGAFQLVYAISVFTHFDRVDQLAWRDEVRRILAPEGLAIISTMGPSVIENFPAHATPETRARLAADGFVYREGDGAFNSNAAFHTPAGLVRLFSPAFSLVYWNERGLDGFQDLSVLRKA